MPYCSYTYYGHREGYNVLYGDSSVRWHGDPQLKMMWWRSRCAADYYWYGGGGPVLFGSIAQGTSQPSATETLLTMNRNPEIHQWHELDVSNGIDVGTTP